MIGNTIPSSQSRQVKKSRLLEMTFWSLTQLYALLLHYFFAFAERFSPILYVIFLFLLPQRVGKAIKDLSCNALLLKVSLEIFHLFNKISVMISISMQVNQIGSVTESIEAVKMAKKAGWGVMTSHRSGETEDTFIADLAVGLSTVRFQHSFMCLVLLSLCISLLNQQHL